MHIRTDNRIRTAHPEHTSSSLNLSLNLSRAQLQLGAEQRAKHETDLRRSKASMRHTLLHAALYPKFIRL